MQSTDAKLLIKATKPMAMADRGLIDLLIHSGLRISEALDLRASDIDGDRITVRRGKGGKRREIALVSTYGHWELWLTHRAARGEEFIFTTKRGSRLSTSHVRRMLGRLAAATGVDCHPHAFRHAHACALYAAGLDLATISRQLGHAGLATTDIYLRKLGVDLGKVAALAF